jgi:16S rRNA (adenine1518-N6/adenine1519-N6)-dimethyltransferase
MPFVLPIFVQMYTLKKSLGQHFLKDDAIIAKIMDALQSHPVERLLEVGPGAGALTSSLIKLPGVSFLAVELDKEKVAYLEKKYPELSGKIITASILDVEPPFTENFTLIGNFPYNISSQILFKVLDWKDQVPVVIGMFQKEVAERAASAPGTKAYGVLSALVQAYYDVSYLFEVPPEAFNPSPKVMSAVIRLTRRKTPLVVKSERAYWVLVKLAFNQRRKTLRNALKAQFEPAVLEEAMFSKRAEQLSIEEFAALTFRMK